MVVGCIVDFLANRKLRHRELLLESSMRLYPNKLVSHFLTISESQPDSPTPSGRPPVRVARDTPNRRGREVSPVRRRAGRGTLRLPSLSAPRGRAARRVANVTTPNRPALDSGRSMTFRWHRR